MKIEVVSEFMGTVDGELVRSAVNVQNLLGEASSWDTSHEFANRLIVAIQDGEERGEDIIKLRVRSRS